MSRALLRPIVCALLATLLQGCATLPSLEGRAESSAPTDTADTPLGRAVQPLAQPHPGRSGVFPLPDGRDAFAARALLARAATRTLDVQYYIWRDDLSGSLLMRALYEAAERGVRVRLLLDDNNTRGLDALLAALDAHPSIEVRLFNPFANRRWRALGYLTDFSRLNRRMHTKSFTADNQVSIVGGRNVGDEYFDAGGELSFADLDVMAAGPVVREVSESFDRYWASASSYPAATLLPEADSAASDALRARGTSVERDPRAQAYVQALARTPFVHDLLSGQLPFEWVAVRTLSDDPAKALGMAPESTLLLRRLRAATGTPTRELTLVSPYFVPTAAGVDALREFAQGGVKVTVLTNSLEATDVIAVHAGYAKRRRDLLEAGVELYELKRPGGARQEGDRGLTGSAAASLHAKTFSADRSRVFVGSFNFDPRSARLNTEMGFLIESASLAEAVAGALGRGLRERTYLVRLDASGRMQWVERSGDGERVHDDEPGASLLKRLGLGLLSVLPIEWML